MDYNENDYEGQNLPLASEESSKISVLRPFALPKFDFEDSLHGHLRFDSLVENEVFLGIPSQEDNHWIEDFSRGGNGIEFSSTAAESCALPRHINVWSEVTSSESVEMLLKAVGQEEIIPGGNMIEESDPGDQLGGKTGQRENNLSKDYRVDDIGNGNPSLAPAEVEGNFSRSNESAVLESADTESTLQTSETKFSSYGVCVDSKYSSLTVITENLTAGMERTNDQGKNCGSVVGSLSNQVKENLHALGKETVYTKRERELTDEDKFSDVGFVSSSYKTRGNSDPIEEQGKECSEKDARLNEIAVEADNTQKHCSHVIPSRMQSPQKEHADETCNFIEASGMPGRIESASSDDGCNEVAFVLEPAGGSQHSTVTGAEIKPLSEGVEGLVIRNNDAVTYGNDEMEQVPVIRSPGHYTLVGNKDASPGGSSLEAPCAKSESCMLHEVSSNPSEKDDEHNINHAAHGPVNLTSSTVIGEYCEKSATNDMKDVTHAAAAQKVNIYYEDHVSPSLVVGSTQPCMEDRVSLQVDTRESNLHVSANEKGSKKLPLDSRDMVFDDTEKEVGSTCSGEGVKVDNTTKSLPDTPVGDFPVFNAEVEDTKLAVSFAGGNELDSKESLESKELPPHIEIGKGTMPDSAVGETKTSDQSASSLETCSVTILDEASNELNKMMEHSPNLLITQYNGVEAAPTKEPVEADREVNSGKNSPALSVTICTVEIDKSNKDAVTGASCTDLSQSEINKQAPLKTNEVEHIGEVQTKSKISRDNDPSREDGSFTFDIRPLEGQSTGYFGKALQTFPRLQACNLSLTGEGLPSVSDGSQTDPMTMKESSRVISSTPGACLPSGSVGAPSERKSRRSGSKSGKGSLKKGIRVKEASLLKQTEKGDKSSPFLSSLGSGELMKFESGVKPRGAVSIPTSSLPDLNSSAPSSAFFQQPFTDLQQVQLRAQIFVYGSLIQGVAPDETCMVSAFDGSRSDWERSWRTCVERMHGQKSQGNNTGTPVPLRSDGKAPDTTSRQIFLQSEVLSSIAGRATDKAIPSHVVNPVIPLSSPLWSISMPSSEALPPSSMTRIAAIDYPAVPPLNPYQTPPVRNYIAHTTWPLQASPPPFPVPWLASSRSSPFEISTNYPAFSITEPVKLAAFKESSSASASGTKHVSSIPATHGGASTMVAGGSSIDLKKVKVSIGQTGDTKTRKRKKSSGAEDVGQISSAATLSDTVSAHAVANQSSNRAPAVEDLSRISLIAHSQVASMPAPVVSSYYTTSVAVTTHSSFLPKDTSNYALPIVSPSVSSGYINKGDLSMDKRALNFEDFSKVEEAKFQAQEAAAHAAAVISHCEGVWSQLDRQNCSGLTSDAESKLVSAAVAIAAAASVAKAAAAAAKIASNAAGQAKQMADEAVTKFRTSNTNDPNFLYDSMNLVNAPPVSILKGGDRTNAPNSAISAAREAARKRIEAASAATRHAENLDAILKAAELAGEAVAHAGRVVTMGDPFSLSVLAEAGPNNYWKASQVAGLSGPKPNDIRDKVISSSGEVSTVYNQHAGPDKDMLVTCHAVSPIQEESSRIMDDHVIVEENLTPSIKHGESGSKLHKDTKVSDSAKTALVVSDPDTESRSNAFATSIKEGSHVEVLKVCGDLKKTWFSANVLSLRDGEALVCYTGLQSDEGSEQLNEWISLGAKDGDTPKIRTPHPMTSMQFEGMRKRRRAAVKDYSWSVGDRVDAWVQDCQ